MPRCTAGPVTFAARRGRKDHDRAFNVEGSKDEREGLDPGGDGKARQRRPAITASLAAGSRSASSAARSTTKPTTATGSCSSRLMPTPRISIIPASAAGRARQQASVTGFEVHAVVRYQPGEPQQPGLRSRDQPQRKARLAGSGGTADQHGAGADEHG